MRKILFISLGKQEDIANALSDYGDVIIWDWSGHHNTFNFDLLKIFDFHKPNFVFMQVQTENIISVSTAQHMSKTAKVVNWTGDVRAPTPKWFLEIGRHIHLTLFSNMHDVEFCRANGIKADYLQIGFPNEIFHTNGEVKENVPEIIFMANYTQGFPLSGYRKDMVSQLRKRYGAKFQVYGNSWGEGSFAVPDQYEEARFYRGAKIGINLSHFNYSRYSSDRLHRLMGAGCFCLSHNYKDIDLEFENGKHLVTWNNFSELFEKIDYYLEHEDERKLIAKTGCEEMHTNHQWTNRINQLMKML